MNNSQSNRPHSQQQQQQNGSSHSAHANSRLPSNNHGFSNSSASSLIPGTLPQMVQQAQHQQQRWNAPPPSNHMTSASAAAAAAQQQQQQQRYGQHSNLHQAALQQSMSSLSQQAGSAPHRSYVAMPQGHQQQQQPHGLAPSSFGSAQARPHVANSKGGHSATWGVPNPLLSNHGGMKQATQQSRSQTSAPTQPHFAAAAAQNASHRHRQHQMSAPGVTMKAPPSHQTQSMRPGHASPNLHHSMSSQPAATSKQPTIVRTSGSGVSSKSKVTLTQEAKQALAKAIWSAIRHPEGEVAAPLMADALRTGLPRHAILNAARVAREREAMKRKGLKPPPLGSSSVKSTSSQHAVLPQQSAHHRQHPEFNGSAGGSQRSSPGVASVSLPQRKTQPAMSSLTARTPVPSAVGQTTAPPAQHQRIPASSTLSSKPSSNVQQAQQNLNSQTSENREKNDEKIQWKRVQNGTFMVQKDRFVALPCSVGAMVRTTDCEPSFSSGCKRPRDPLNEARELQKILIQAHKNAEASGQHPKSAAQLLDPERFKRIKIEPKKHARALDRHARKARQSVAEGLGKQLKDLHKQLGNHQTEFTKFHRNRRSELAKLSKSIRESFDKEEKKKEKDAAQAEKARLAALRANDMTAYSKLLEETRNDRLKFLLEKTERHFSQISSLLQKRSSGDDSTASAGGASYYATAHMKTEEVRQPSILVGGDLKEYQLMGLQWLVSLYNNNLNGILADEMGLGKTIQAISLVAYLMEFKQNLGPFLVIVPLSTLSNWQNEFTKWCPAARVVCYKGLPVQRREIYKEHVRAGHFNVLLTTYEYIIRDKKHLRRTEWQYAIVDEGHRMKNAESKFAVTLGSQYSTKHRILLTGTPLMNDLSELWSLLNFLLPTIFNSVETFDQWFSRPFAQFGESKGDDSGEDLLSNEERILIIHRLHELLRPFMLRRVKSEVLDQLPEKVEKVLRCDLSSWQKELYKQISRKAVNDSSLVSEQAPTRGLNNVVMQLRKVCNHPYLFTPEGYHINDIIVRSSGKMVLLDQMLPKFKLAGHRVLLFTQMTAVMTILEEYFALRGFLSLRLDGSTPAEEREKRMYKFNSPDSPYFIFLLSTRAGGLGLNLTAADAVIIFDSDWNPMMDLQAQDRAHRIGQRSTNVSVFRLITNSPVEEKILSRATEKLNVSELVVESGKFNKESVESDNSLERKRLMEVLLTDFDGSQPKVATEKAGSDDGEDDDMEGSDSGGKEDLNELLSNNEMDYQIYSAYDEELELKGEPRCVVFDDDQGIPDWILHPTPAGSATGNFVVQDMGSSSRKRKAVTYDDGLTEKQFLRIMEQKADEEEGKKPKKRSKTKSSEATASAQNQTEEADRETAPVSTGLTDWTFRKLISCSKSVVELKDPRTKRKLSEIFLEKPDPATFPDYYEIIEKPIAINDILRKCRAKLYADLQEFKADWKLMFANALKFNGEGSWVVEDAQALQKELERVLKKNGFSDVEVPIGKKKKLRIKLSLKDVKGAP